MANIFEKKKNDQKTNIFLMTLSVPPGSETGKVSPMCSFLYRYLCDVSRIYHIINW